jgi:hypothetical protein
VVETVTSALRANLRGLCRFYDVVGVPEPKFLAKTLRLLFVDHPLILQALSQQYSQYELYYILNEGVYESELYRGNERSGP